jgi:hypothetical protein
MRYIVPVIRSQAWGSDEERRRLCYARHQVWMVTIVVTLQARVSGRICRDLRDIGKLNIPKCLRGKT